MMTDLGCWRVSSSSVAFFSLVSFLPDGEKIHYVDVLEVLLHAGRVKVGMRKGIRLIHLLAFLAADFDVACLDTKHHSFQST